MQEEEPPPRAAGRKGRSGGGTELAICLGIIVVLGIACGVLYVHKSKEQQDHAAEVAREKRAKEANIDRAFQAFMKAQSSGHEFVTGAKQEMTPEELFASLRGDPTIYNVIFTWTYKKKSKNYPVQHALFNDNEHMNVKQTSQGVVKEGISITYGYTGNDSPIVIAQKMYPPAADDKSNLGGEIMVIVNAERQ